MHQRLREGERRDTEEKKTETHREGLGESQSGGERDRERESARDSGREKLHDQARRGGSDEFEEATSLTESQSQCVLAQELNKHSHEHGVFGCQKRDRRNCTCLSLV